jgi:hypothetical protein
MQSNAWKHYLASFVLVAAACASGACSDDGEPQDTSSEGSGASGSGGTTGAGADGSGGASTGLPSCAEICPGVMAAQCPNGPPTEADCVSGCNTVRMGPCADVYTVVAECAGTDPDYACDQSGAVIVTGCEAENAELSTCLAAGGG